MLSKSKIRFFADPVFLQYLLGGGFLLAFTFPEFNPVYSPGLDPPLAWVFNHIFYAGNQLGKEFVFPHGPLSFLLYPLPMGHTILIAQTIYTLLKLIFFCQVAYFFRLNKPGTWLLPLLLVYVAFLLFEIQFVMLGVIVSGFSIFLQTKDYRFAIIPVVVAALGLYMRAYIAITGSIAIISFMAVVLYETKNYRNLLKLFSLWLATIVLIWFGLYHTLAGLMDYFAGRFYLAIDNSTAASYYPVNNWTCLFLGLICLAIIPFLQKSKEVYLFYVFFLFILFAQWKYSMARQDIIHSRGYFILLILFFTLLLPLIRKRKFVTLLLAILSMGFYYRNLPNVIGYSEFHVSIVKLNPFADFICHYSDLEKKWIRESEASIRENDIGDSLKKIIGNQTVDCYPWDYTFIPANNLKWQPRPVIQSYASYTSWLDNKNAAHFNSDKAPHFILWHLAKTASDPNGSSFETLDERYPLNDEPHAILSILSNYFLREANKQVLLLEKRKTSLPLQTTSLGKKEVQWNKWCEVPPSANALVRVKATIRNNFAGKLKSLLYKNEACYILLRTSDRKIYRYRIVPKNAEDGIWINPLILHPEQNAAEPLVTQILFQSTNTAMQKEMIPIEWEGINPVTDTPGGKNDSLEHSPGLLLGRTKEGNLKSVNMKLFSLNTALDSLADWDIHDTRFNTMDYVSPPQSCMLDSNSFSNSYLHVLDSSLRPVDPNHTLEICAGVWSKAIGTTQACLVISLDENGETFYYKTVNLKDFTADASHWNYTLNNAAVKDEIQNRQNIRLKVYVWNPGNDTLLLDDFQVGVK